MSVLRLLIWIIFGLTNVFKIIKNYWLVNLVLSCLHFPWYWSLSTDYLLIFPQHIRTLIINFLTSVIFYFSITIWTMSIIWITWTAVWAAVRRCISCSCSRIRGVLMVCYCYFWFSTFARGFTRPLFTSQNIIDCIDGSKKKSKCGKRSEKKTMKNLMLNYHRLRFRSNNEVLAYY